jgi:collagenase-like PrtC family protease
VRLSVACNFDPALLDGLAPYPVYEVYGKLTSDAFGGGRPSFYLPAVGRADVEDYVARCHARGVEFNYLLNATAMGNVEFTREGQRELESVLDWVDGVGVDSVTVGNVYFLRLIKRRHPRLKVRISSHRYSDNPRKVRFWEDNGADCVVVSEVNIHREFEVLRAMREAVSCDLSLIVNNWCRQDCAIACNHAVSLNAASQKGSRGFPLDYSSVICNELRLEEPVNYLRANWIRPEDLHLYEDMGYHNFKIVERNTPTQILLARVKAYAERRYDGNLLDLVQNYAYDADRFTTREKDAYSLGRLAKYFLKPKAINLFQFLKVVEFGTRGSVLFPRRGPNPVQIDNRALDGFIDRFARQGCQDLDCESCRYCHRWADQVVHIDPQWKLDMRRLYRELFDGLDGGTLYETHAQTLRREAGRWARAAAGWLKRRVGRGGAPTAAPAPVEHEHAHQGEAPARRQSPVRVA